MTTLHSKTSVMRVAPGAGPFETTPPPARRKLIWTQSVVVLNGLMLRLVGGRGVQRMRRRMEVLGYFQTFSLDHFDLG